MYIPTKEEEDKLLALIGEWDRGGMVDHQRKVSTHIINIIYSWLQNNKFEGFDCGSISEENESKT